jgi:hypothetical protein
MNMPDVDYNKVNVDDIVKGAIGDKPVSVKQAFDDEMLNRVADVISGKRDEVVQSMVGNKEPEEVEAEAEAPEEVADVEPEEDGLDAEVTDDELEAALDDEDENPEEELPTEEEQIEDDSEEESSQ